ncbi:alpha/beta-hydrolase [Aulographum hederae CBS 113979]|uniref:Alpha/beta-hydrolase n=1 Tax=Aulographum hederae CBS 113979 TaxID=1176131 RepID=A0A6G1H6Y2_9PEZI|nr:alpha/beta-hydrolase [Aulographum hederae CBS 113979]
MKVSFKTPFLAIPLIFSSIVSSLPSPLSNSLLDTRAAPFDPNTYTKKFVTCPAVDRSGATPRPISLKLAYLDINPTAKKTLVMLHGWPSLWTTYRHQIQAYENSEYRLIIPEHRGYGDSEHPADLQRSNAMFDFVNDAMCIMDNASVPKGVCVGNDFGAQVCWEAGRYRPDRFIGVFNVGIPYLSGSPSLSLTSLSGLTGLLAKPPKFQYQLYLATNPRGAARELDADARQSIRSCARLGDDKIPADFLTKTDTFLGPWETFDAQQGVGEIPASGIMSGVVEDYMVASYKKQGFYNTFNGYQLGNQAAQMQFAASNGSSILQQPTFTLYPTKDPVADWEALATVANSAANLRDTGSATIATAHWPQEEQPEEFNRILEGFLGKIRW